MSSSNPALPPRLLLTGNTPRCPSSTLPTWWTRSEARMERPCQGHERKTGPREVQAVAPSPGPTPGQAALPAKLLAALGGWAPCQERGHPTKPRTHKEADACL